MRNLINIFHTDLVHSTQDDNGYIQVQSSPLHPHLKLSLPFRDFEIIRKLCAELSRYGLQLQFSDDSTEVSVTSVPACFLAREMNEVPPIYINY